MPIKDLQARQGNAEVTAALIEKGDVREFSKFGKTGRVCNATLEDESGKISLTLWNDDIDKVNAGDTVKITNGWVGEYQGELQLSTGKFGSIEVVKKETPQPAEKKPKKSKKKDDDEAPMKDEELVDWN
ncbi:MAG TPA: SOSS complex subunit B family protein [Candidatus Nanoarchaeia archaeon]|nr:SOSS complex subunit B family protein [Candidatus Nanoarchaeia archaeon]